MAKNLRAESIDKTLLVEGPSRKNMAARYGGLCFLTHFLFITISLVPGMRASPLVRKSASDAITYIAPANNILAHGVFSSEPKPPYLWEPNRSPGYPILIAVSTAVFGRLGMTLYWAALTAGFAGWSIVRLTKEWRGNVRSQHLAGLVMALLPNSLGLSAEILVDAVFGHLLIIWLFTLLMGLRRRDFRILSASALLLMLLPTIKPTMNLAFLVILGIGMICVRDQKLWVAIGILTLLSLVVPGYFSMRILRDHGVFSSTFVGVSAGREYLQGRFLAETTHRDFEIVQTEIGIEDTRKAKSLSSAQSFAGRLYLVQKTELQRFVRAHPISVIKLMMTEAIRQFAAPQEFGFQTFWGELPNWARILGSAITVVFWIAAFVGTIVCWQGGESAPGLLVFGLLGFFLITGSVSHLVGARLRFPADVAAIPIVAIGLSHFRLIGNEKQALGEA